MGDDGFARAFREWERRYREDPTQFASEMERSAAGIDDYGERCAAYFRALLEDTQNGN